VIYCTLLTSTLTFGAVLTSNDCFGPGPTRGLVKFVLGEFANNPLSILCSMTWTSFCKCGMRVAIFQLIEPKWICTFRSSSGQLSKCDRIIFWLFSWFFDYWYWGAKFYLEFDFCRNFHRFQRFSIPIVFSTFSVIRHKKREILSLLWIYLWSAKIEQMTKLIKNSNPKQNFTNVVKTQSFFVALWRSKRPKCLRSIVLTDCIPCAWGVVWEEAVVLNVYQCAAVGWMAKVSIVLELQSFLCM
jgi:hypothetical protein